MEKKIIPVVESVADQSSVRRGLLVDLGQELPISNAYADSKRTIIIKRKKNDFKIMVRINAS